MSWFRFRSPRLASVLLLGFALGGCSADTAMFRADWNWWSRGGSQPAPAPAELVSPEGACAPSGEAPRGVALGMSECDLVRLAGPTTQIAIASDASGERVVTITYPEGERAGIYQFRGGRLASIERVPEAAKPPRKKPAPKRARAKAQAQAR